MADGFDIHLDRDRAALLKQAADANGVSETEFVLGALDKALEDDWAEDHRRFAEYQRTGEYLTVDEWMGELRRAVAEKRLAKG